MGEWGLTYCFNVSHQWRVVVHIRDREEDNASVIKRFRPIGLFTWEEVVRLQGKLFSPKTTQEDLDKYLVLM